MSEETAGAYLAAIGDTPEVDEQGCAIVRNEAGAEIAPVRLGLYPTWCAISRVRSPIAPGR